MPTADSALYARLLEAISALPVIDCHEHLVTEDGSALQPNDLFRLFSQWAYIGLDLEMAGMSHAAYLSLLDPALPLEQRWQTLEPWWPLVRRTTYGRFISLTAEKLYGISEINRVTYRELSRRMAAAAGPALIRHVIRDVCNIRRCLVHVPEPYASDLVVPVPSVDFPYDIESWQGLSHPPFDPGAVINSLDDVVDACREYMRGIAARGAVGIKAVAYPHGEPQRALAEELFADLRTGRLARIGEEPRPFPLHIRPSNPLRDYIHDRILACAGELGLVVSVHTGYWGDFRNISPLNLVPEIIRHPEVKFDIFHLGYPWLRETLMLCKGFSNVWLNLCWVHIISQQAVTGSVAEILDTLPLNKVLAFGGDFQSSSAECIYGHLAVSRENISRALAGQVELGRFNEEEAVEIARKWYYENPVKLYGLQLN